MTNTTKKKVKKTVKVELKRYVVRQESPYDTEEYRVLESFDDEHTAMYWAWKYNHDLPPECGTAVLVDTKTGKRNDHCYPVEPVY